MAGTEFLPILGEGFVIDADGADQWPAPSSSAALAGPRGRLIMKGGAYSTAFLHLRFTEGMSIVEEYDYEGGTLAVFSGGIYNSRTFEYFGDQNGVLWSSADLAVWSMPDAHPRDWFVEYFRSIVPTVVGRSIVLQPQQSGDWMFDSLRPDGKILGVSVPGVGHIERAQLNTRRERFRTRETHVGTVLQAAIPQRGAAVFLDAAGETFQVTPIGDGSVDVVQSLDQIRSIRWVAA